MVVSKIMSSQDDGYMGCCFGYFGDPGTSSCFWRILVPEAMNIWLLPGTWQLVFLFRFNTESEDADKDADEIDKFGPYADLAVAFPLVIMSLGCIGHLLAKLDQAQKVRQHSQASFCLASTQTLLLVGACCKT